MIDYTLKECPFCGCPAEVVIAESFHCTPDIPAKKIRCSNVLCFMHDCELVFLPSFEKYKRAEWNTRRRKDKYMWDGVNDKG